MGQFFVAVKINGSHNFHLKNVSRAVFFGVVWVNLKMHLMKGATQKVDTLRVEKCLFFKKLCVT